MWQGGFTPFLTSADDSWSLIQDTALDRPPYVLTLKVIRCVRTISMGFPTWLLKTATSVNSPVCSFFSYCELNTANWILSDNQENNVIVVFFLPLTKVQVVMSTTSVLQDEQLHFSFTIVQNIQHYPNITKVALVRQCSPVVTIWKMLSKHLTQENHTWRFTEAAEMKKTNWYDVLSPVNTFSLNLHTHASNY